MILGTRATSLYLQREILLVGQLYASWPTRTYSVQIPPTKKTSRPTLGSQLQVMSQPSSSNFRDLQLLSTRLSLPLCISPLNPSNLEGRSMFLAAPISSNTFTATPLLRLLGRSAPLLLSANAQVVVVRRWKVTYTSPNIGRSRKRAADSDSTRRTTSRTQDPLLVHYRKTYYTYIKVRRLCGSRFQLRVRQDS